MARENLVQARLNEREYEYLTELCEQFDASESEVIRLMLFDSRFLYSDEVSFGDINIEANKLISESDSTTNEADAVERVAGSE